MHCHTTTGQPEDYRGRRLEDWAALTVDLEVARTVPAACHESNANVSDGLWALTNSPKVSGAF
jgi:hypothetical protein